MVLQASLSPLVGLVVVFKLIRPALSAMADPPLPAPGRQLDVVEIAQGFAHDAPPSQAKVTPCSG